MGKYTCSVMSDIINLCTKYQERDQELQPNKIVDIKILGSRNWRRLKQIVYQIGMNKGYSMFPHIRDHIYEALFFV